MKRGGLVFGSLSVFGVLLFYLFRPSLLRPAAGVPKMEGPVELLPPRIRGFPSAPASKQSACLSAYVRLFSGPVVKISIVLGYKDARPARFVGDRYERFMLESYLLAPCPSPLEACGFLRDPSDADRFTKQIVGPDGKMRTVDLRVHHSSAGPDDEENRVDPYQTHLSQEAHRAFFAAFQDSDIVFYNGHSRDGGGPDFLPPRLRKDGSIDFSIYQRLKEGERALLDALTPQARVKLLGVFSCKSTKHFSKEIEKKKRGLALLTQQKLLYYTDALRSLLGALSGILEMRCESDLDSAMDAESIGGSSHLTHFFES